MHKSHYKYNHHNASKLSCSCMSQLTKEVLHISCNSKSPVPMLCAHVTTITCNNYTKITYGVSCFRFALTACRYR